MVTITPFQGQRRSLGDIKIKFRLTAFFVLGMFGTLYSFQTLLSRHDESSATVTWASRAAPDPEGGRGIRARVPAYVGTANLGHQATALVGRVVSLPNARP